MTRGQYTVFTADGTMRYTDHAWPEFAYRWTHLPSGETGTRISRFTSASAFGHCLQLWNAQQPHQWSYEPHDGTVKPGDIAITPKATR